jgi:hypothetical protein
MQLSDVRAYAAAQIAAAPALAALGAVQIINPFTDPNVTKSDLATQAATTGVVFEIGVPELSNLETRLEGRTTADAMFSVYIAESPTVTHTPSLEALIEQTIAAVCKRPANGVQKPARMANDPKPILFVDDNGLILHRITFWLPIFI